MRGFRLYCFILGRRCFGLRFRRAGEALSSSGMTAKQIEDLGEIVEVDADLSGKLRASVKVGGDITSNAELTGHHDSNDFISCR